MDSSEIKAFLQLGQTLDSGEFQPFGIKEVELELCSYALIRGVDDLGKISTGLRGGNISFASTKIPSVGLLEWAIRPDKYYSGYIHFRDSAGQATSRLFFENATCVNMKISFENEGGGYIAIHCALQAERLTLQETLIIDNKWNDFDMDSSYNAESEGKDTVSDFLGVMINPEVALSGYMTLGSIEYELRAFEMEFIQEVDALKGQPQTSIRGGFAHITLFQLPHDNINKWLSMGEGGLDGTFIFGDKNVGFPLKMPFTGALCVGYFAQCMDNSSQNVITRLNVVPAKMSLNGVEFSNYSLKK